ncbi:MAG TPA: hypothetical protein VK139_04245 [Microbacteriaceae bacterium]|nr:hypothetical protein [Microbacteriaceae bacterium]
MLVHGATLTRATYALMGCLLVGVVVAILLAGPDPWWHRQVSALAASPGLHADVFNVTLITAGGICLVSAARFGPPLRALVRCGALHPRGFAIVRAAYLIEAVAFLGAGIVSMRLSLPWHNVFGVGLLAGPLLLMLSAPHIFPTQHPGARMRMIVATVIVVVAIVLFVPLHLVNLTVMEIAVFLATFGWLGTTMRWLADTLDARKRGPGRLRVSL